MFQRQYPEIIFAIIMALLNAIFWSVFSYADTSTSPPSLPPITIDNYNNSAQDDNITVEKQTSSESEVNSVQEEKQNAVEVSIQQPLFPAVNLQIRPPENKKEALERVKAYKILLRIMPPGTSHDDLQKQIFGQYKKDVMPYLDNDTKDNKSGDSFLAQAKTESVTIENKDIHDEDKFRTDIVKNNQEMISMQQNKKHQVLDNPDKMISMEKGDTRDNKLIMSKTYIRQNNNRTQIGQQIQKKTKILRDEKSFPGASLAIAGAVLLLILVIAYWV